MNTDLDIYFFHGTQLNTLRMQIQLKSATMRIEKSIFNAFTFTFR